MERVVDVFLTPPDEQGWWVVECPSVPGAVSQGKTEEEAMANIKESIEACLEVRREAGLPETVIARQVKIGA